MPDIGHCRDCSHKFYLQGTDLANIVQGGGCPACGGHQVYRTQISPSHSEMETRDMVDPGSGQDMGGNPLQEGILGTTDGGWGNRMKRDESFASVKHAGPMEEALGLESPQVQAEHQLGWTPGMHGRALFVGPDMHSWNAYDPKTVFETNNTGLQHGQYVDKLGIDPKHVRWDSGIEIEPDGGVDPLAGRNVDEHIAADPRLHKKQDLWGFSSIKDAALPNMLYEHTDIPEGMMMDDYHHQRFKAKCQNCGYPFITRENAPPYCASCLYEHPELVTTQQLNQQFANIHIAMQHVQVLPSPNPGIHNGPQFALGNEGVLINGEPANAIGMKYTPANPEYDPAQPVTLSHADPNILEAARKVVESGNEYPFHGEVYNAHQEEVQPHPNGFSHDVIMGLGNLDAYVNNARLRNLASKGQDGQMSLEHDGSPVVVGAKNPEELAVAKRVISEGSSNPAREYRQRQQQVQAKASALAVNKRHMDTLGQTIYMPWTVESTTKEAWLGPLGDAVDAAGGVVNDATAPIGSAIDTATGALPQPIQDVGHFVGKHAIPIGAGLGVLAGGALIASGIGAPAGAALEGVAAPALVGGEAAAAGADAAGAIGAGAAADAGATAGGLGSEMALADSGIAASRGSAVANTLKGALSDPKGLATNAARGAIKKIRTNALGGAAGYGGGQAAGGGGKSLMPGSTSDGGAGIGNYNIDKGYWGFQGSTKEADYETPTSMPSIPGLGNDTYEDPREFADGASTNNLNDPTINGTGGTDSIHPAIRLFHEHLPLLLHYYDSDESGRDDPNVLKVHRALDAAHPGYLAYAGHGGIDIRPHEHHHAKTAVIALPGEKCPKCGMPLPPQGPCPKCGYNPQQAVTPATGMGALPATGPQGNMPIMPVSALDQGPQTDEQKAAVAEILERNGRAKEIPLMLEKGYLYAKELAQVQHKLNQPPPNVPIDQQVQAPPPPQPGGNMPMPGMQSPQPALSSIIKRFAVDNVAPKCPKCDSHTTGVLSEDGQCRCHKCGNTWKEKLEATKIGADSLAPRCPKCKSHTTGVIDEKGQCRCHSCGNTWNGKLEATKIGGPEQHHQEEHQNVLNAPAAEQQGQRDVSREQDSSHMWATANGEPLRVGNTYQMHSGKYNIPDIIRIESVKPDSIDFVIESQYGLDPRDSVTHEEAQLERLSFTPYNEAQKDGEDLQDTAQPPDSNNQQGASPGQVSDLSTPHYRSNITTATNTVAGTFGPQVGEPPTPPKPESPPEPPQEEPEEPKEEPKEKAPKKSSVVCSSCQSDDITSELHSPEVRHFDCFRCGHAWNEYEDDELDKVSNILPEESRAWIQADSSGPIAHVAIDKSGESRNGTAGLKTAGAKFTPSEQRDFIDEKGKARNSDRLDLEDTHYKARFHEGNGDLVDENHLALGI